MNKILLACIVWCGVVLGTTPSMAATKYVDNTLAGDCTSGNYSVQNRSCTGADGNAWNTLAEGVSNAAAGDTVYVRSGTYSHVALVIASKNTVGGARITFSGYPGESRPIIDPNTTTSRAFIISGSHNITVQQFKFDSTNTSVAEACCPSAHNRFEGTQTGIIFQDNEILGAKNQAGILVVGNNTGTIIRRNWIHDLIRVGTSIGTNNYPIYWQQGTNAIIEYNDLEDGPGGGLHVYNGVATGMIVRYNKVHHNTPSPSLGTVAGILFFPTASNQHNNITIHNNEVYLNGSSVSGTTHGIDLSGSGTQTGARVFNNTVYGQNANGLAFGIRVGHSGWNGTLLANNLIAGNKSGAITNAGTATVMQNNACVNAETCDNGTVDRLIIASLDTCTVNAAGQNYTQRSTSTCINAGTSIAGFAFNGSAPDIGAHESFGCNAAAATGNTVDITCQMNLNVPLLPGTGQTAWVVKFGGTPRTTVSAGKLAGTDSVVRIQYDGVPCSSSDVMTVDYTAGNVTDSALIGNAANQALFSFTGLAVDESGCTGGGGGSPPSGTTVIYHLNDASLGVCCADSSGNNNDGTISGTPTLTTGAIDGALAFSAAGSAYLGAPWGSGVNPTATDSTVCAFLTVTDPSLPRILFGTPPGTNQRAYVGTWGGNWVIGIQSSSGFAVNNDFPVQAGYALPCVTFSGTTATLWVNAVAGTSAQSVKTYSSHSWAGNWTFGRANGWDATTYSAGNTTDEIFIYPTALNQTEMTELFESLVPPPPPPPSSTREQKGHKFQRPFKKAGVAEDLRGVDEDGRVSRGGYVDVVIQIDCTADDCPSFAPRIYRSIDGGATYAQVNDVCGVICFRGTSTNPDLVSEDVECCLKGALTEVDGPTNFTSAAVPNITLSEDHSITLRYKLKVASDVTVGQEIYLKVYDQNGNELEGGYTPALGAKLTVKDYANGGGF